MFKKILGPSPLLFGVKRIKSNLSFRGGNEDGVCLSDDAFFEVMIEKINPDVTKPRRLTNKELRNLLATNTKSKLTKEQKLLKSVIEEASLSKTISEQSFQTVEEMYHFRRKYKNYLRIKRFVPLSMIAPFTGGELSKMAYAAALGSKSISLTLPGLIGYSLPAFVFFHMSYFYVPDKIKPICQFCKFTLGCPFWVASAITDEVLSGPEEKYFGEEVPIDLVSTGGTIPGDLGDINKLSEILEEMKNFATKTH
jgi:hypothetical protein